MNNKERLIWVSVLILFAFFCDRKIAEIERLKTLDKHREVSSQIQSNQLLELSQKINELSSNKYQEGFEHGKTQALIASINKDNIFEYSEGYHAAVNQFGPMDSNQNYHDMLVELLKANEQSIENYAELLNVLSDKNN